MVDVLQHRRGEVVERDLQHLQVGGELRAAQGRGEALEVGVESTCGFSPCLMGAPSSRS